MKRIICLIIGFSFIGFIINLESSNKVYDITYSKEFVVTDSLDYNTYLYFRIKVDPSQKMGLTIKVPKDEHFSSSVNLYIYKQYPSDDVVISGRDYYDYDYIYDESEFKEGAYRKYIYPFDTLDSSVTYLVITFNLYDELNYLSVLVSPYKERQRMLLAEITYNKEYIIDSETLSNTDSNFMFYLPAKRRDKGSIRIKLHKDDTNDLMVNLIGTAKSPMLIVDQSDIIETKVFYSSDSQKKDSNYIIYKYDYTKLKDQVNYMLVQAMSMDDSTFKYFSITVGNGAKILSSLNIYSIFALFLLLF